MKLLTKLFSEEIGNKKLVLESGTAMDEDGSKFLYIEGIFAMADCVNRNRRNYPSSVLMPEVERYIDEWVSRGNALGELDHPDRVEVDTGLASHLITDLRIEGTNVIGKARILEGTPRGDIVAAHLRNKVQLGVSTRGVGDVNEGMDGISEVTDYYLSTVDVVANPSAPKAYVRGLREGVEFMVDRGIVKPTVLENFTQKVTEEQKLAVLRDILKMI